MRGVLSLEIFAGESFELIAGLQAALDTNCLAIRASTLEAHPIDGPIQK
jgi:hypothetical protein